VRIKEFERDRETPRTGEADRDLEAVTEERGGVPMMGSPSSAGSGKGVGIYEEAEPRGVLCSRIGLLKGEGLPKIPTGLP